jgi:hypothetical protein
MMIGAGVTTLAAGVARCSDRSCPVRMLGDADATRSDDVHGLVSLATFVLWAAMPLVVATRGRRIRGDVRAVSALLGCATIGGWLATARLSQTETKRSAGLAQRVMVGAALSWFPVVAVAVGSCSVVL